MSGCSCQPGVEVLCTPGVEVEFPASIPLEAKGQKEKAIVSSTTPICKGEFVQKELEYVPQGDALRFVRENVTILDTTELSQGRVGIVFSQNGKTKFKIAAVENGAIALGNTLVLLEDEALTEAVIVEKSRDRVMILYNQDGDGLVSVLTLNDRAATLAYTDAWGDGDPANLAACVLANGTVLAGCMLQGNSSQSGHPGEAWVYSFYERADGTAIEIYASNALRVDVDNDTDLYAHAWSMTAVDDGVAVLCYPRALEKTVGYAVLDVEGRRPQVRLTGSCRYAGALPTLQTVALPGGKWAVAYGLSWLSADNAVNKSALAVEVWGLTRYAAELLAYACEDARHQSGIGGVSCQTAGVGFAISYTGEEDGVDQAKAVYVSDTLTAGATVSLPTHSGFCRVTPISTTKAILVYSVDGNGYAQAMVMEERIIPSSQMVDGLALQGGNPGETITIQIP